ncbi:MAG: transporter substrate-binding domain-containing protein [Methylococcaceae bacterium]
MKNLGMIFMLLFLSFGVLSYADDKVLIVGSEQNYPPFALGLTNETADGFTVELWKAVAAESHLNSSIRVLPFHDVLSEFQSGNIDVLINLAQSDERRKFVDFTVPHVIVHGAIFVRYGDDRIHSEEDLNDKKIIVLNADLAHDYAISKGWEKQLVLVDTAEEGFKLLASEQYDALLLGKLTGKLTLEKLNLTTIDVLPITVNFSQKFSFAVQKGNAELLAKINEGLALTKASGIYDKLYNKWFGVYEEKEFLPLLIKYLSPIVGVFLLVLIIGFYVSNVRYKKVIIALTKSERKLASSNAHLQSVFDVSPIGYVLVNHQNKILLANKAISFITGISISNLLNMTKEEFLTSLSSQTTEQFATLKNTNQILRFTLTRPRHAILLCGREEIYLKNQAVLGKLYFFHDVTKEEEANRIKSEFLMSATHELRTPLATIHGYSELLNGGMIPLEMQPEIIEMIYQQSSWLINMITELLDLSRIEERAGADFVIESHKVTDLIQDTIDNFTLPEGRTAVVYSPFESEISLNVDKNKFKQALNNILDNAYKYSPNGGNVWLNVNHDETEKTLEIEVRDEGLGLTEDDIVHVFDRFFRVDKSGNVAGVGLGLSLSKEIFNLFNSDIYIKSIPNEGSSVFIQFKLVDY